MLLVGVLIVLSPLCVAADVLQIPLALSSPVMPEDVASADFELGVPPAAVTRITMHLEGEYERMLYYCEMPINWESSPACLDLLLGDDVENNPILHIRHEFPESDHYVRIPYSIDRILATTGSLPFLADGIAQAGVVTDHHAILDEPWGYTCAFFSNFGTVTVARLDVTYDPLVALEDRTWGAVKRLYR